MKVLVLGSGVIGVSAAYQLALAGHDVVVVDRQPAPAMETSFANAGEVSPGYSAPWAGPGRAAEGRQVAADAASAARHPRQPRHRDGPVGPGDAAQLHRRPLRSQQGPHDAAGRVQPRLPEGAAGRAPALPTTNARAARCSSFAPASSSTRVPPTSRFSSAAASASELLDAAGCIEREPALATVREKFVGGLLLPGDETGDCFKFTQRLADLAARKA